jgi:glycosyltransferase involved in cell wall biosynthesis
MRVSLLTSWNDRCGIAEYSRLLVQALERRVEVEVVPATFLKSARAVYAAMGRALDQGDVAHVQHSYAFFGGMHPLRSGWAPLAGAVTKPLLATVHELDMRPTGAYHLPPALETAYKERFNRSVFLHPAIRRWLVHSAALRDGLVRLGAPEERVFYIPHPIAGPPEQFPDPEPLRRSLGLVRRRPLVILGFLARRKGYDVALEALRRLPPEFVLVAAGGEHTADRSGTEAWLREEATRAGVADRLRITGYLSTEALEQVTALAEVILAPFHEMSASGSLSYALARGKAVIASDLPENQGLGCVRLFPAGDAASLAAAIEEVAESPLLKRELSEAAARYADAHSYEALADQTLRIYEEMV